MINVVCVLTLYTINNNLLVVFRGLSDIVEEVHKRGFGI